MVLVFRKVPAEVCGEEYVDEETMVRLLSAAEEAVCPGILVDVREYVAA